MTVLIGNLTGSLDAPSDKLLENARVLDKFYIPTRYPNGFDSGAPTDYYTRREAEEAVRMAEEIIEFSRLQID